MRRLLFGSTEDKRCFECGMMIPWSAKKCPFCHSTQDSTLDDIHQYGCLTMPTNSFGNLGRNSIDSTMCYIGLE